MSDLLSTLLDDLKSDDESIRRFAIEDLGDDGDPAAAEPLAALLHDPATAIREAVVDALIAIGEPASVTAVIGYLRSEDAPVRNAACEVLAAAGGGAVSSLGELLSDPDKDVRQFAVDTLLRIGDPACAAALRAAVDDPEVNVAASAVEALAQLIDESQLEWITRAMNREPWVRCAVARGLAKFKSEQAACALQVLTQDSDPTVRMIARHSHAEAASGGPQPRPEVDAALADPIRHS